MIILKNKGNLLEESVDALVNTVNCVGIMGKGIALQFKKAYPQNYLAYKKACTRKEVHPGKMFVYPTNTLWGVRFIINFPTKKHWKEMSRIEYIENGLNHLLTVIQTNKISSIAIPPLGCGNGGLEWEKVKEIIINKLKEVPETKIILYEPGRSPEPEKMVNNTTEPKITPGRAALLGLLKEYIIPGYELSLLEIQKLMFFLQEFGEPLRLNYVKEKYGPYANNLNHVLEKLEGHYIIGFGDRSYNTPIKVIANKFKEAEEFLKEHISTKERFERVKKLIDGYETPYGLELLATVYWVVKKEGISEVENIIDSIQKWNTRKKNLFGRKHILKALERLISLKIIDIQ